MSSSTQHLGSQPPAAPVAAPLPWYGGKYYYAKWIISHFAEHSTYVEPFGGMASVLLSKPRVEIEVFNDLDQRVANLFRVIRDRSSFDRFLALAALTPYSRAEFRSLCEQPEPDDPVEAAWRFFVICRQARGGLGMSRSTASAWATSSRARGGLPEPVSKYLSAVDRLPDIAERFRQVIVEDRPALDVIARYDSQDTLFYCDPPYPASTRHGGKATVYGIEMADQEHIELLEALRACKGRVAISSYDSDLYDSCLPDWRKETLASRAHVANSGQDRTEVLWLNWEAARECETQHLF